MGSSSRKRAQKRADFVKPKLKVGKARPKPDNTTSTSFASRRITLPNQQTLQHDEKTSTSQLQTHLSYLKSTSSSTRSEHLSALSSLLPSHSSVGAETLATLSISTTALLNSLNPLILDPSSSIRRKLPELYKLIPPSQLDSTLPYIRAGLSHLNSEVRGSSADLLVHLINYAGTDLLSCPGSWVKGLNSFCTVLGWEVVRPIPAGSSAKTKRDGWTSSKPLSMDKALETKLLTSLTLFLSVGLNSTSDAERNARNDWPFPLRNTKAHLLPTRPNAFAALNLFGEPRDEEGEMYTDAGERGRVFKSLGFAVAVTQGIDRLRGEGGDVGRAAGGLSRVLREFEAQAG